MKRDREKQRRRPPRRTEYPESGTDPRELRHGSETTLLHDERLDAVARLIVDSGAATVLDLGCGAGSLLSRLAAREQFTRIVGVDSSAQALVEAERTLAAAGMMDAARVALHHGSFLTADGRWQGFDAAAMVEAIEHVAPEQLSRVEHSVFVELRPSLVVVSTPNREYNVLFGLDEGELRHPDHSFEWSRSGFRSWASGVGRRNGYGVIFEDVGLRDPLLGSPTQIAAFRLESR